MFAHYGVVPPPFAAPYPGMLPFFQMPGSPQPGQGAYNQFPQPTQLGLGFLYPSFSYPFTQDPFAIPGLPALPSFYQQSQFINPSNLGIPGIGMNRSQP